MSALARLAVRVAARALPRGIRARYREEWLADLEGAKSEGVGTGGIAVGALLFSATLDRDAPEISGEPLPLRAQRHARWAVSLLLAAGVLGLGSYLVAFRPVSDATFPVVHEVLLAVSVAWPIAAVTALIAGVVFLWRAAAIASLLSKVSAALGTVGIVLAAISAFALDSSRLALPAALLALAGASICGLIAWTAATSGQPARTERTSQPNSPRQTRRAAVLLWLAMLLLVAVGAADLLVWSPLWQAPGFSTDEIWAALSPVDRAYGMGHIVVWIAFWAAASISYLVFGLLAARRFGTARMVLIGLAIVSAMVFFQFWAGFSLGMSIADTLPPYRGGSSEVAQLYAAVGQLALIAVIVGGIAPRHQERALVPAAT